MSDSDRQRLLRIATYWQFYLGRHWAWKREEGEPQITMNYSRAFVDKTNAFMWGKGFNYELPDENRGIVGPVLDQIWEENQRAMWGVEAGQMGSITGDLFIKVAWEDPSPGNGLSQGRIRMLILDSSHCFPTWHPHHKEQLIKFRISYQYEIETQQGKRERRTYTEVITKDMTIIIDGDERVEQMNNLGYIPIVHAKNRLVAGSSYGLSDLADFTTLNREYNEKLTNISDIINYHEAPTTIVYGAKATQLERGAGKMWAGLPVNAKVENLKLEADLGASAEYLDKLKLGMHEVGNVPEAVLGQKQEISNTSGVALNIQYMPLIELRDMKALTYGRAIEVACAMALHIYQLKNGLNFKSDFSLKDPYKMEIKFPDTLPKDKLILLQEIQQRMMMPFPLITPPDALKMLGVEEKDLEKKLKELKEWRQEMAGEQQEGPGGEVPNNAGEEEFLYDANGGKIPINTVTPPGGMDVAGGKNNIGGIIHRPTMTPQGAARAEMNSISRSSPGF